MKDVRILVTGGTIDKVHDARTEALDFLTDHSHIPCVLDQGRCNFPVVEIVMLKDSLDFEHADREAILAAVSSSKENAILITHGTGTMQETARYLAKSIADKTVVLTGAMRPFSLSASDAAHSRLRGQLFQRSADMDSGLRGQNPAGVLST